jgi:glycosyltransferase involved in cell wall biosynthesis
VHVPRHQQATQQEEERVGPTSRPSPLVSIIIPTHRSEPPFLAETLASVIGQEWTNWEVIVVDDGSPDPDALCKLVSIDPRIGVVRSASGGVARARNLGFEHAQGDLVAFLDYDDIWYPNHLSTAIGSLATNLGAAASYSAFDVVRGAAKEHVRTARQQGPVTRHTVLSGGNRPSITTMVIRRDAMAAAGGFDPTFDGADDLDLVYRLVDQGPYVRADVVTVAYRKHDDNWSKDSRAMASGARRVLAANLDRVRAAGDVEAAADLGSLQHNLRRYLSRGAMVDAVTAARSREFGRAVGLAFWAIRSSPSGVASMITRRLVRVLTGPFQLVSAKTKPKTPS